MGHPVAVLKLSKGVCKLHDFADFADKGEGPDSVNTGRYYCMILNHLPLLSETTTYFSSNQKLQN